MWLALEILADILLFMHFPNPFERKCPHKPGRQYPGFWAQALLLLAVGAVIALTVWGLMAA